MQLFITMKFWDMVRDQFSELEKQRLNEAIEGESICPRGIFVNVDKAGNAGIKLKHLVRGDSE